MRTAKYTIPIKPSAVILNQRTVLSGIPSSDSPNRSKPTNGIRMRNTFANATYAPSGFPKIVIFSPSSSPSSGRAFNSIDLRGENEVTLREAVDLVGIDQDFDFPPCQADVRMMPLFFSN